MPAVELASELQSLESQVSAFLVSHIQVTDTFSRGQNLLAHGAAVLLVPGTAQGKAVS